MRLLPPASPRHHYVLVFTTAIGICYIAAALLHHTAPIQRLKRLGGNWGGAVLPRLLGLVTFLAGAVLLFSGAVPAEAARLRWIEEWIPLPVVELSHFFDNVAGVSLLILARGVERRLDVAYHLTIGMLVAGILLSILRAFDIEQAAMLTLFLVLFLPSRKYFYRKTSLVEERFTSKWIAAIVFVVLGSIALGIVSYTKLHLSTEAFFHFSSRAQASRFLRATAGVLGVLLVFTALRLMRPARPIIIHPTDADLTDAQTIAACSHEANAQLAFLGDKYLLFNAQRTGFMMYGVSGRSWVSLGDPVAPVGEVPGLIREFIRLADRNGGWPVFYKTGPTLLYLYLDHGLSVVKLGEEARVALADFSLEGPRRRNLRRVWRRAIDDGYTFEVIPAAEVAALLPDLRLISDAWLSAKQAREKGFSLGFFDDAYVCRYPAGIVRKDGTIVAFANIWLSGAKEELEVDLMRYTTDAPPGIMRPLLVEIMLWGKAQGFRCCNLGMAPLSGLSAHAGAPIWNQLSVAVRGAGERFYNFEGIREFKQWFYPEWSPRFLISAGGAARPVILANIASLIAGGLDGVVKK
ncbi:MAG TPA: phosphatidylglycerol lysyltransferase domain-containing protein [Gemmatimonadaceae bacterium]|nr:phosphatidylglycerol lysyltransferase domain-containing protein [Gemmatimonadaceae bacterium]